MLSPTAFRSALEHRIREEAARQRRPPERLQRRFLLERFAGRVAEQVGDAAALRGSLAVDLRAGQLRDVRLLELCADDLGLAVLTAAGARNLGDYLRYTVAPDPSPPLVQDGGFQREGESWLVQAWLVGRHYGPPLRVHVARPRLPASERAPLVSLLPVDRVPEARTALLDRTVHLAEAFHAYTLPFATTHPRTADLFDLALLAATGPVDALRLREALRAVFQRRATHEMPLVVPRFPPTWNAPLAERIREERLPWPTPEVLLGAVRLFLTPVLAGQRGSWNPATWRWAAAA